MIAGLFGALLKVFGRVPGPCLNAKPRRPAEDAADARDHSNSGLDCDSHITHPRQSRSPFDTDSIVVCMQILSLLGCKFSPKIYPRCVPDVLMRRSGTVKRCVAATGRFINRLATNSAFTCRRV